MKLRPAADVLAGVLALGMALAIYVLGRDGLTLHAVCGDSCVDASVLSAVLPSWVRYSLVDGLWQYALAVMVLGVWHDLPWGWQKIRWTLVPLMMGSLVEGAQLAGWVAGTFDPFDVLVCMLASAVALAMHGGLPWCTTRPTLPTAKPGGA